MYFPNAVNGSIFHVVERTFQPLECTFQIVDRIFHVVEYKNMNVRMFPN